MARLFGRPPRRLVVAIIALWCAAALPGLAVLSDGRPSVGALGEALSYLAPALLLASVNAVRAVFSNLGRMTAGVLPMPRSLIVDLSPLPVS